VFRGADRHPCGRFGTPTPNDEILPGGRGAAEDETFLTHRRERSCVRSYNEVARTAGGVLWSNH
jgi:hypothetical protein